MTGIFNVARDCNLAEIVYVNLIDFIAIVKTVVEDYFTYISLFLHSLLLPVDKI